MTKKSALISGVAFAIGISIYYCYKRGNILSGIIGGLVGGLVYRLLMYLFYNSQWVKGKTTDSTENNEPILYTGGANHFLTAKPWAVSCI